MTNIDIEIYLKAKKNNVIPKEIHNLKWKASVNNVEDAIRFLNRMACKLPQDKINIICVDMNFDNRRTTAYCYNIREFYYFTMGFHRLAVILGYSVW